MTRRPSEWMARLNWAALVVLLSMAFLPKVAAAEAGGCWVSPSPAEVSVGSYPTNVAVSDWNRDGNPDIVTANVGSSNLSIRLGDGTGHFAPANSPEISVGNNPFQIAISDLNGDGKLDIAVVNQLDNSVSIRLGNGDGTFHSPSPPEISVGYSPHSFAIADLNGDGKPDIVAANHMDNSVSIRLGNGDGTFHSPSLPEITVGELPRAVAIGDLNRDGKLDLVTISQASGTASIRLGNGDGTFTVPATPEITVGASPLHLALVDLNGDARLDIVVARTSGTPVSIRLGGGDGTFQSQAPPNPPMLGSGSRVRVADVDGDGKLDIVVADSVKSSVSIHLGDGTGQFISLAQDQITAHTQPAGVAIADLNRDGRPDIVVTNQVSNDVSIRLNCQVNAPPVVTVPSAQTTPEDVARTFSAGGGNGISIADPDIGSNQARVSMTAAHGVLTLAGKTGLSFSAGDGTDDPILTFTGTLANVNTALNGLVYLPVANFTGADQISITVDDLGAGGQDGPRVGGGTLPITVTPVNDPPTATNDAYTVQAGTILTVNAPGVLANDIDLDSGTLTAVLANDPVHGTLALHATGRFTYTPAAGFAGVDTFVYRASDGVTSSSPVTVTITVSNAAPIAGNDSYLAVAGASLTVSAPGVLANDADADSATLTAVKVADPAHGSVTLNADGSFTYTPAAGYTGNDSFTYRASDGVGQSGAATVGIVVMATPAPPSQSQSPSPSPSPVGPGGVGAAPIAANDTYIIAAQTTLTTPAPGLLVNDAAASGLVSASTLTAVKISDPAHGSLTLNSNGSFTYVPAPGFAGTDGFMYRATDGTSASSIALVTITVAPTQCGPRPKVQTTPVASGGKLSVRLESVPLPTQQNNPMKSVTFGPLQNAKVTMNGQPVIGGQAILLPANTIVVNFTVERVTPGQATTVPLTVTDGCGDWKTFVGGGAGAGF